MNVLRNRFERAEPDSEAEPAPEPTVEAATSTTTTPTKSRKRKALQGLTVFVLMFAFLYFLIGKMGAEKDDEESS